MLRRLLTAHFSVVVTRKQRRRKFFQQYIIVLTSHNFITPSPILKFSVLSSLRGRLKWPLTTALYLKLIYFIFKQFIFECGTRTRTIENIENSTVYGQVHTRQLVAATISHLHLFPHRNQIRCILIYACTRMYPPLSHKCVQNMHAMYF